MPQVAVLLLENCQPSAVFTVIEALHLANVIMAMANKDSAPLFSWRKVSLDGKPVPTMCRASLSADCSASELGRADLIFAPAIDMPEPRAIARTLQKLEKQWGGLLREHHTRRRYLAANCSTTFLLAEAGLLNGKQATTSWWLAGLFRRRYPEVELLPDLVVKDTRIFTAAAYSAVLNLALEIISEFVGSRSMLACARVMLVDANRTQQSPYADLATQVEHGDALVLKAQTHLLKRLRHTPDVAGLAAHLNVTSRTLERRFKKAVGQTPLEYLQGSRIENTKRLLATTQLGLDEIAHRVGYEDPGSLRRIFVREAGISPGAYRKSFAVGKRP
jgi:transcriptional regulator GlxA family with amidase domain